MIIVNGHLTIDPAQRDAAEAAIAAAVAATRAEPGNVDYRFSADLAEPNRINMVEIWQDQAAVDAHMGTDHLAAFMAAIGPCVSGSVSITSYDVSGSTTLL
ncbi:MAG: antibiotic biosynthesis monooxygenase [Actinobacteria bacterium]|nr:antibiotic biosynthesis monooxygenase [Actinomycetota bacterium]